MIARLAASARFTVAAWRRRDLRPASLFVGQPPNFALVHIGIRNADLHPHRQHQRNLHGRYGLLQGLLRCFAEGACPGTIGRQLWACLGLHRLAAALAATREMRGLACDSGGRTHRDAACTTGARLSLCTCALLLSALLIVGPHAFFIVTLAFGHQLTHLFHIDLQLTDLNTLIKIESQFGAYRFVVLAADIASALFGLRLHLRQFQLALGLKRAVLSIQLLFHGPDFFQGHLLSHDSAFRPALQERIPSGARRRAPLQHSQRGQ